jgi:hypothetical protein
MDLDLELIAAPRKNLDSLLQLGNWMDPVLDAGVGPKLQRHLSLKWVQWLQATIHNSGSRFNSVGSILISPEGYIADVSIRI